MNAMRIDRLRDVLHTLEDASLERDRSRAAMLVDASAGRLRDILRGIDAAPKSAQTWDYRVTRPEVYGSPSCPGHTDASARQGYYRNATSACEAALLVAREFPHTTRLDVQSATEDGGWGTPLTIYVVRIVEVGS